MILKNYWKWLEAVEKVNFWQGYTQDYDAGLIAVDGSSALILLNATSDTNYFYRIADNHDLSKYLTIRVGSSDNEVTSDDYALDNDITSSISNYSYTFSSSADDGVSRIVTIQGSNNSNNVMTIKQIAICKDIWYIPSSYAQKTVMFAVCVLDEPIVVQPHNNFKFIFEWLEQ